MTNRNFFASITSRVSALLLGLLMAGSPSFSVAADEAPDMLIKRISTEVMEADRKSVV